MIPLRVHTENSTARLVYASIGSRQSAQLTSVSPRVCGTDSSYPPNPTSGCQPTSTRPATRVEIAVSASRPAE